MALTRDNPRSFDYSEFTALIAGSAIYEGGATCAVRASGLAVGGAFSSATHRFAGFAKTRAASGQRVTLQPKGRVILAVAGAVAASANVVVFASDDNTFTISPATTDVAIGRIAWVQDDGKSVVDFDAAGEASQVGTNAAGTALVSGGEKRYLPDNKERRAFSNLYDILKTDNLAPWNDLAGAGVTAALDATVTFNGRPTIRLDIPANYAGGTCRIGSLTALSLIPSTWDKKNMAFAIRSSNLAAVDGCLPYLGESNLATFFMVGGQSSGNQPQMQFSSNGWMVFKPDVSNWSGAGTIASAMRLRMNFNVANVPTATQVWIGFVGIMPKRPKPTIILSPDDGFKSWPDFLVPLLKHHRIPASFACTSALAGGANYWTPAQAAAIHNDPSCLFEVVNHNRVHLNVGNYATAQDYYNDVEAARVQMAGWGITGKSMWHHAYPNSVWRDDLIPLLAAGGYKTARASSYAVNGEVQDQMIMAGDKLRWKLNIIANLQAGTTPANVQTQINALKAQGGAGWINMHDLAAADGAYVYSYSNMTEVASILAAERDAGNIDLMRWSDWYDKYCTH